MLLLTENIGTLLETGKKIDWLIKSAVVGSGSTELLFRKSSKYYVQNIYDGDAPVATLNKHKPEHSNYEKIPNTTLLAS